MSEITRTEKFLRACIDGEPCALKPLTRVEKLLAELNDKLAGGTSEVVILPETELTVVEIIAGDAAVYLLPTPFENAPVEGGTYKLIWGGVEYISKAADITEIVSASQKTLLMGNSDVMGVTDAIGTNPAPDAPFFFMIAPDGSTADGVTVYGQFNIDANLTTDPPVLSIVEKAETASAGGGGLVFNVAMGSDGTFTADTTYAEVKAALDAGRHVLAKLENAPYVYYGWITAEFTEDGLDVIVFKFSALGVEQCVGFASNDTIQMMTNT